MRKREDVLFVDGYNMIGAWPELIALKQENLEDARDLLLEMLTSFQSYSGWTVVVVFDAFRVPGPGASFKQGNLHVVYTREKETADECIERLVGEWASVKRNLYVATSDMVEQHVAFGRGALRLSARELKLEVDQSRRVIKDAISKEHPVKRNPLGGAISSDVRIKLEKLRRGEKENTPPDGG